MLITSNTSPVLSRLLNSPSTPRTPISAKLNHHYQIPPLRAAISITPPVPGPSLARPIPRQTNSPSSWRRAMWNIQASIMAATFTWTGFCSNHANAIGDEGWMKMGSGGSEAGGGVSAIRPKPSRRCLGYAWLCILNQDRDRKPYRPAITRARAQVPTACASLTGPDFTTLARDGKEWDESLASIDVRGMPSTPPETSPVLSCVTHNANAHVRSKGGAQMEIMTTARQPQTAESSKLWGWAYAQAVAFPFTYSTSKSGSLSTLVKRDKFVCACAPVQIPYAVMGLSDGGSCSGSARLSAASAGTMSTRRSSGSTHRRACWGEEAPARVPRGWRGGELGVIKSESTTGRGESTNTSMGAGAGEQLRVVRRRGPLPPGSVAGWARGGPKTGSSRCRGQICHSTVLHRCFIFHGSRITITIHTI
ncbi:hypothetical protein FIBSPDRAFT_939761 [Athelia psychrophila]|uniref:Uncharacterized protein n=1 Tax=Athelia psychrophila TaxID=1759441 RepID=A0A167X9U4_9AGAM|nr:hypothetical protein FIBSPDRAFT_939761 [Fibularhizoctonia sp. CBS 109695]